MISQKHNPQTNRNTLKNNSGGGLRLTGKTIVESSISQNYSTSMRTGSEFNAIDKNSQIY